MTVEDKIQTVISILTGRQQAYRLTFGEKNLMAQKVLRDLARFCRANESTYHVDSRVHAVAEGRREVFLRICRHLDLDTRTFLKTQGVDDA